MPEIIFTIKGEFYHEGHWYKDDDGKKFMIVRATRF